MLNFTKFAQDHRITYITGGHHHAHQGWAQLHCPQCTDGRHGYHLGFNLSRGNWNCWRCGPIKTIVVIRALLRVSEERAWEILRAYSGGRALQVAGRDRKRRRVVPPPGLEGLTKAHMRYLRQRGFPKDVVEEWELQGTGPSSGRWSWRVVGPVKNERGEIVAYAGRSIKDIKPKVLITEDEKCGEDPKAMVYGIGKVPEETVIVVEGLTDVWNMGPGACATFGIDWKLAQANRLRRFKKRFIMFDPEPKAQRKAEALAHWLSFYPGETEIIDGLPSDPGSLPRARVRRIRRQLLGRS